jgi:hypothetical protein
MLEGANTQDAAVRLGIREGMMYRVLGQPIVGSKGILDCRSDQTVVEVVLPLYTHLGDVEEIFNPLGVSLGASES